MTKTIKILRVENTFSFQSETVLFMVDAATKKLEGKTIFEKVYQDVNPKETTSITIDQSGLTSEDQKTFGNYVVDLFSKLDEAINAQFAVTPKDGQQPVAN
jgi:hypothetical protein